MRLEELKTALDQHLQPVTMTPAQAAAERNLLLKHTLDITPEMLYTHPQQELPEATLSPLYDILERRVQERIPIQYLLEEAVFYGLTLKVTPAVLIPRPETELLVEQALAYCQSHPVQRVLDLGTGSGCIAIALKVQRPSLDVTAVDLSAEALAVAEENARRHHAQIHFRQGSWFEPVAEETFDMIVSNPPYIAEADRSTLWPEVLQEPEQALFAPEEPLAFYTHLIAAAAGHLSPRGAFFFELGAGQAEALQAISQAAGFHATVFPDYAGVPRILTGERR